MLYRMNTDISELLPLIDEINQKPVQAFWNDLQTYIADAAGSSRSHQAWPGGYKDHI